jgi:hypothetical protein
MRHEECVRPTHNEDVSTSQSVPWRVRPQKVLDGHT